MKSLDKLRHGYFSDYRPDCGDWDTGDNITNYIEAEIDRYYLPRPLFDDGEPVQPGDEIYSEEYGLLEISEIRYRDDGSVLVNAGEVRIEISSLNCRIPRPPDTQEKIDEDKYLTPYDYVQKHFGDLVQRQGSIEDEHLKIDHLLERQRKVDGMKS